MVNLVNKLMDAEVLLESVGMVHWLRQEDKIPEYEDFLNQDELLELVRLKPKLTGTPWDSGTVELDREELEEKSGVKCDYCSRPVHTEAGCWKKKTDTKDPGKTESKRKCWKCGSGEHLSRCTVKVDQSNNKVKVTKGNGKKQNTKKDSGEQEIFSHYLRTKDCRWCGRSYNFAFTCSGCGTKWAAKGIADQCLAHCSIYA